MTSFKTLPEDSELEEKGLGGEPVFSGRLLHVFRDRVSLPDGSESTREFIVHPGASAAVVVNGKGEVLLERQWRYPLHRAFWEIPAGKLDGPEDPLVCAKRELLEETGFEAERWEKLGHLCPGIGYSNEVIHLYLASGLTERNRKLDPGEFLNLHWVPFEEALRMALDSEIDDSKTITALFRAAELLSKRASR